VKQFFIYSNFTQNCSTHHEHRFKFTLNLPLADLHAAPPAVEPQIDDLLYGAAVGHAGRAGLRVRLLGSLFPQPDSVVFFPSQTQSDFNTVLNWLKLSWLIPLPYALLNFYSFFRYPALRRATAPAATHKLRGRLYFRYVTRGNHPKLIAETIARACEELTAALPPDAWALEVVVDNPIELDEQYCATVIVVPPDYQPPKGARYKARALHYALSASPAQPQDWIIHLDEETRFNGDTVRAIHAFAYAEEHRKSGRYPRIGQGIILYAK